MMPMHIDVLDIVIVTNPFSGAMEQVPIAMVNAYVPYASHLRLEEAAKVAIARDEEAAQNLLLSIEWAEHFDRVVSESLTLEQPTSG